MRYKKREARDWARQNMQGCACVIIPSFSDDLERLNEAGIRNHARVVREAPGSRPRPRHPGV